MRRDLHAVTVTIRRGAESREVRAAIGRSQDLRLDDAAGFVLGVETRDYKIAAADYAFGSGPVEPEAGDLIDDASTGETITYVVRPIAGEDAARWADRYGVTWRIHTKRA